VVVLPEIGDEQVPNAGKFEIAEGRDWLLQPPAQWVRQQVPELREAEERWGQSQQYEALCLLYVALTRAKRGLYVLLPQVSSSRKEPMWSSPVELIRTACGCDGREPGVVDEVGDAGWWKKVSAREIVETEVSPVLVEAKALRARATPSGEKKKGAVKIALSPTGMKFGSEVHAAFERVGWIDEEEAVLPDGDVGAMVGEILGKPTIREIFERRGRDVRLFREQAVEAILDGKWLSGVVDRLHVFNGGKSVEVIDFKTDAVSSEAELSERYAGQMEAYRKVIAKVYPGAEVKCLLVSTKLGMVVCSS
jgi:ATP-dependent exoDNAse (exonuclease V) beta subunit